MPEVSAGRIPGAGGALFLKRRKPFSERLGEGLAGAAQTIGGGLIRRAERQQLFGQRQQQQGQAQLMRLLPQIIDVAREDPEAAATLLQSVAGVAGVEAPDIDLSGLEAPGPSPGEQLQQFAPGVLKGAISPEQLPVLAESFGIPTTIPTGIPQPSGAAPTGLTGEATLTGGPERTPTPELSALQRVGRMRPQEPSKPLVIPRTSRAVDPETGKEIVPALPDPEEEEDPLLTVGGGVGLRERILEDLRAGRTPQFAQPPQQRQPQDPRVNEQTVIGDVGMRGIPGMRPQFVGKPVRVQFRDGQPVRVLGQAPENVDPFMEFIMGRRGAQLSQPPAQDDSGFLENLPFIGGLFGGGEEQPSAPPDDAAAQLLRSQGVPVTPKNLELAREQLRRRSGGAQR